MRGARGPSSGCMKERRRGGAEGRPGRRRHVVRTREGLGTSVKVNLPRRSGARLCASGHLGPPI